MANIAAELVHRGSARRLIVGLGIVALSVAVGLAVGRLPSAPPWLWLLAGPGLVLLIVMLTRSARVCLALLIIVDVLGFYLDSVNVGPVALRTIDLFWFGLVLWVIVIRAADGRASVRRIGQPQLAWWLIALGISLFPIAVQSLGDATDPLVAWLRLVQTFSLVWLVPYAVRDHDDNEWVLGAVELALFARDRPLGRRRPAPWELRGSAGGRERPQHHRTPRRPPDRGGGPRARPASRSPSGGDVGRRRHRSVDVPVARCDRGHRRRARHLRAPAGGRCQAVHAKRTARAGAHRAAGRRRGRDRCQLPSREPPDVERVPAEHHRPPRRARHRGARALRRQSDRGGGLAAVAGGHQRPRAQRAAATPVRIGDQSRVPARPEPHQRAQRLHPGGGGSRPHRVGDVPHAALRGDEGDSQRPAQRPRRSTDLRVRALRAGAARGHPRLVERQRAVRRATGDRPRRHLPRPPRGDARRGHEGRGTPPTPVPAVRSRRGSA